MNTLTLLLKSNDVNGRPYVRIILDEVVIIDQQLTSSEQEFNIILNNNCKLVVDRYGKTTNNTINGQDQILEVVDVKVDSVLIPQYIIQKFANFISEDQTIYSSIGTIGPNGQWRFNFATPIITWILDQKILYESQWNQDYLFPWALKLGPDSVKTINQNLELARQRVNQVL